MVDRIIKINPHDHPRIDEPKDALEDEGGGGDEPEQEEEPPQRQHQNDGFNRFADKSDWGILVDQPRQNQKKIDVSVAEIEEIRFLKINLKTNPSLMNVKILLKDGMLFSSAYVSIPRHVAVPFQHYKTETILAADDLTDEKKLSFFVPELKMDFGDEVTRVTALEKTFSQTIKMIIRKTWAQKIGWQDPETKATNKEVILAYITVVVVVLSLVFAVALIMF